jgi:hypothetical protein
MHNPLNSEGSIEHVVVLRQDHAARWMDMSLCKSSVRTRTMAASDTAAIDTVAGTASG